MQNVNAQTPLAVAGQAVIAHPGLLAPANGVVASILSGQPSIESNFVMAGSGESPAAGSAIGHPMFPKGNSPISSDKIVYLPRGGVLVKLASGNIQFGSPPETVKDTMSHGGAKIVVIDKTTAANWYTTTNQAEPEFIMYYGFFVRSGLKDAAHFLTTAEVAPHLDMILKTSYLGPQWDFQNSDLAPEYPQGEKTVGFPNMVQELKHFAGIPLDRMRKIDTFGGGGVFEKEGVKIVDLGKGCYRIFENGELVGDLDLKTAPQPQRVQGDVSQLYNPHFQSVRYRVMFQGEPMKIAISSSHGFDKNEGTSGHMLWNNGRAVLVDPPANILDFLSANHIPIDCIDGVVLTHVHADHDQGTLQVLLANKKIKLYTTLSIERMFIDKLHALSLGRFEKEKLSTLWKLEPLQMLTPTNVNGLQMMFYHGFHANVAFGYNVLNEKNQPIYGYSGDTLSDPRVVYGLLTPKKDAEGKDLPAVISSIDRANHIVMLPMSAAFSGGQSSHDQGDASIHTKGDWLKSVDGVVQVMHTGGGIVAYHLTEADALKSGMARLGNGFESGISFNKKLEWKERTPVENIVRGMSQVPVFSNLSKESLEKLARVGRLVSLRPDSLLMEEGKQENKIYVMIDGDAVVSQEGHVLAVLSSGLIGEGALLGKPRNATVRTRKPSTFFEIDAIKNRDLLNELGVTNNAQVLRDMRPDYSTALARSEVMRGADMRLIDSLLLIAKPKRVDSQSLLIRKGEEEKDLFFIRWGEVNIYPATPFETIVRGAGDFVGEMALVNESPRSANVLAKTPLDVLQFEHKDLLALMDRMPSMQLRLMALVRETLG